MLTRLGINLLPSVVKFSIGLLLLIVLIFFKSAQFVYAELPADNDTVFIDRPYELEFKPVKANFIIELRIGDLALEPALIQEKPLARSDVNGKYIGLAGAQIKIPNKATHFSSSLILHGAQGELAFLPARKIELADKGWQLNSSDKLRQYLLTRKEVLQSWNLQISEQEQSLDRLREDAEVIGNVGRIIELQDETRRVRAEIANLEKDFDTLKRFLSLVKSHAPPQNFARRELELTGQLASLATAAKQAESGEIERKFRRESELHSRLEVLESTREEDPEALKQQLAELRLKRLQIEKQLGISQDEQVPVED